MLCVLCLRRAACSGASLLLCCGMLRSAVPLLCFAWLVRATQGFASPLLRGSIHSYAFAALRVTSPGCAITVLIYSWQCLCSAPPCPALARSRFALPLQRLAALIRCLAEPCVALPLPVFAMPLPRDPGPARPCRCFVGRCYALAWIRFSLLCRCVVGA